MRVTLRQLSYFEALAEERNFVRAAGRVSISQPALSMQIRDLEATLEVTLVERLPREVRLTRAGREVLVRARRILAEVGDLEAAARRQALSGQLNLGVIPTVAPYLLPVVLSRLRASDITRDLRVREAQTDTLLRDLEIGALDAVVVAAPAEGAGLAAAVLFEDRFLLAASSARIAALGREVETLRPRALDPGQLLLLDEGHCLAGQALEVCAVDRRHTRVDLGASSLATLCGLVAEGFGLTFLPEIAMVAEQAAAPAMETLRFAAPEPARTIIAVRRASTEDDGWFTELAAILRSGGEDLVATARGRLPPKS